MPIKNRFADMHAEITGWRRHLHQYPELQFDVHETAKFVEDKLRSFGITDITTGIGRTGVVAVIEGRATGSGRTVGLRADMDALPIEEATGLEYASKVPGKMHACGHDGHTAILLGAAQYLAETLPKGSKHQVLFQHKVIPVYEKMLQQMQQQIQKEIPLLQIKNYLRCITQNMVVTLNRSTIWRPSSARGSRKKRGGYSATMTATILNA